MSIRQIFLLAFALYGVIFAVLLTGLVYIQSRASLQQEISSSLTAQAIALSQSAEALIFERIIDLQSWRDLDLVQEIKIQDVDKRLARFLLDIKRAYAGVYLDIICVIDGEIIASSDPRSIGGEIPSYTAWLEVITGMGQATIYRPEVSSNNSVLAISGNIQDAFTNQELGKIYALVDWREMSRLLNYAARDGRVAILLDRDASVLAASDNFDASGVTLDRQYLLDHADSSEEGFFRVDSDGAKGDLLVGFAKTGTRKGHDMSDWSVSIILPESVAFSPIGKLSWLLSLLLFSAVAAAFVVAYRLSSNLAEPIQALSDYSREIGRNLDIQPADVRGSQEIMLLAKSFNRMVEDLRHSRMRLMRADKLAAAGEMAAKLAHEVRTPLGIIRSSAQVLERHHDLSEQGSELVSFMILECDRINRLVTGLLENTKTHEPDFDFRSINDIINKIVAVISPELADKSITISTDLVANEELIRSDIELLTQALRNLIINAYHVLSVGGTIQIRTVLTSEDLCIHVEDDGPGVEMDQREAVLESFVSFREGGIGLGLPIVREIAEIHGGELSIQTSALGGACFTIRLPRTIKEQ